MAHDRVRAPELFDFEYQLEMFKPAHKRRWGYCALPVLHGDRPVEDLASWLGLGGVEPAGASGAR